MRPAPTMSEQPGFYFSGRPVRSKCEDLSAYCVTSHVGRNGCWQFSHIMGCPGPCASGQRLLSWLRCVVTSSERYMVPHVSLIVSPRCIYTVWLLSCLMASMQKFTSSMKKIAVFTWAVERRVTLYTRSETSGSKSFARYCHVLQVSAITRICSATVKPNTHRPSGV